jgi:hypothetical protein
MSVAYAEAVPYKFTSGTGAALYDPAWLYADELEADQRRTHIAPTSVRDPVLRDVLIAFQDGLIHQLADMTTRISASARWSSTASLTHGAAADPPGYAGLWLPAIYALPTQGVSFTSTTAAGFLDVSVGRITTHLGLAGGGLPTFQYSSEMRALPIAPTVQSTHPRPGAQPLAVNAVEDISEWLGVPAADVFRATGIKKRTYQQWKKAGTRRPRVSSEGRLWELHQLAADLIETMSAGGVQRWFSQDPARRKMLRSGDLDKLASQAYTTKTTQRPAWAGAGSPETHAVPRRDTSVGPMDPGDVVEPGS